MSNLRDSLQSVYDRRGELTPALVVAEASPEDHPLHDRFEWDDSVAGPKYREVQARELIRSVRIVYREKTGKEPERSTRYWQSVRGPTGHVYKPSEEIVQDEVLTQIVLRDMERDWRALKERYGHFAEFVEMVRKDVA